MNYREARVYLEETSKYGSVFGLETMRELLKRLGDPQDELRFIHVSGTNGKGSVLAYLSTVLSGAGFRTGRYISPTLFSYRERIQVDGEYIDQDAVARHVTAIAAAVRDMEAENAGSPTVFELETAMAFLYFKEKKCDLVVLETGLGGAMDATNVVKTTILEVIASISMDHMDVLGDTLEKIAAQKAGIIKPGTRVVSAHQEPEAEAVLARVSREQGCAYQTVDPGQITHIRGGFEGQTFSYKGWKDIKTALVGSYQVLNAALALEAVEALRELGFALSDQQVYQGMAAAQWRGRFTLLHRDPAIVIDGAHNPGAAQELRRSLELYFSGKKLHYVFGIFRDKDYKKVIELTAPLAEHIITVETPNNPRALPADELARAVAEVNPSVEVAGSIAQAVEQSMKNAKKEDAIIIFGSLSFLGEAEKAIQGGTVSHG